MCEELKCKVCGKLADDDCNFDKKNLLCNKHRIQLKRYGKFLDTLPSFKREFTHTCCICGDTEHKKYGFCNIEGEYYGKEMCGKHINQMQHKGMITDITPSDHTSKIGWSKSDVQTLVNSYMAGECVEDIAKNLGRTTSAICAKASELGLPCIYVSKYNAKYKAPYKDYEWCYDRFIVQGKTCDEMAEEAGCKPRTIQKWCGEIYGLNVRTKKEKSTSDRHSKTTGDVQLTWRWSYRPTGEATVIYRMSRC